MDMFRIRNIDDVVAWRLCMGCGICYSMCPENAITLEHVESVGIRPRIDTSRCRSCGTCLETCPGVTVQAVQLPEQRHKGEMLYGSALELYEGYASDPEVRFTGSSGGALSALSLYCLDHEGIDSILHIGMDESMPWRNKSCLSSSRSEVLSRAGSRYAPSSPGELLRSLDDSRRYVFIGKPCDAAGVMTVRAQDAAAAARIPLVMTFFCAGVPSTRGTIDLISRLNQDSGDVTRLRYRGNGWPGEFTVDTGSGSNTLPYKDSWGFLTRYVQWRCRICPHGVGQASDIACGDAWHRYQEGSSDTGRSLILVRTERGREIVRKAVEKGYLTLEPAAPESVLAAQVNLLSRHKNVFGRMLAMRLTGMPVPRYRGFPMLRNWMGLPFGEKVRSVGGTLRRIVTRKLWKRGRLFTS